MQIIESRKTSLNLSSDNSEMSKSSMFPCWMISIKWVCNFSLIVGPNWKIITDRIISPSITADQHWTIPAARAREWHRTIRIYLRWSRWSTSFDLRERSFRRDRYSWRRPNWKRSRRGRRGMYSGPLFRSKGKGERTVLWCRVPKTYSREKINNFHGVFTGSFIVRRVAPVWCYNLWDTIRLYVQ